MRGRHAVRDRSWIASGDAVVRAVATNCASGEAFRNQGPVATAGFVPTHPNDKINDARNGEDFSGCVAGRAVAPALRRPLLNRALVGAPQTIPPAGVPQLVSEPAAGASGSFSFRARDDGETDGRGQDADQFPNILKINVMEILTCRS